MLDQSFRFLVQEVVLYFHFQRKCSGIEYTFKKLICYLYMGVCMCMCACVRVCVCVCMHFNFKPHSRQLVAKWVDQEEGISQIFKYRFFNKASKIYISICK